MMMFMYESLQWRFVRFCTRLYSHISVASTKVDEVTVNWNKTVFTQKRP